MRNFYISNQHAQELTSFFYRPLTDLSQELISIFEENFPHFQPKGEKDIYLSTINYINNNQSLELDFKPCTRVKKSKSTLNTSDAHLTDGFWFPFSHTKGSGNSLQAFNIN